MSEEIRTLNIFEYIELIKEGLDKLDNTLKNEDSYTDCDTRIETLLDVMLGIIYRIDSVLSACYGDDEK
jgi:hypothetical protein